MSQINWNDILADWAKVGTMLVVSRLFSGENLQDPAWQRASLLTLLGFTAYHLVTKNLIDTEQFGEYKPIADDWLKVGTMMVVSRLLSGQPLDQAWLRGSLFTLIGFTLYNLLTKNFIKGEDIAQGPGVQAAIDDIAKVGTMLVSSQLLSGGNLTDPAWQKASLGTLLGFTVYDLLVKGILKQ